jgi:hypothetical protein
MEPLPVVAAAHSAKIQVPLDAKLRNHIPASVTMQPEEYVGAITAEDIAKFSVSNSDMRVLQRPCETLTPMLGWLCGCMTLTLTGLSPNR